MTIQFSCPRPALPIARQDNLLNSVSGSADVRLPKGTRTQSAESGGIVTRTHRARPRACALTLTLLMSLAAHSASQAVDVRPSGTNYVAGRGGGTYLTSPASSATELLQCLLGPDVTVTNAVLIAAAPAAGTFVGALDVIGFDQGIILSSGDIGTLAGPNTGDATSTDNLAPGDADLESLIPGYTTYDAAILEFDFECTTAQNVVFQYAFGSEEYNEWVNTPYNDVFGFFLNGTNIALAPIGCSNAGSPVSINNVNCGNPYVGMGPNCDCFRNNDLDDGGGSINTELDGLTQVFYATGTIQSGTNHIKIAIADAGDQVLDSDVMIRCQSFTCGSVPTTGACCLPSGQCVTLTLDDCTANGGTYYGDFVACTPSLCGTAFGACCFPDLSCEVEDPDLCAANGGDYQGDGVPCVPSPCGAAVGACCFGTGLCELTDPNGCVGEYLGDWTSCDPNPCVDLAGACCADVAICEIQLPIDCGDVFLGIGTVCDPNPCEAIIGACCHDNGFCAITLEVDCGDTYMGNRTVCDPNPCGTNSGVDSLGERSGALFLGTPSPTPTRGEVEIVWSLPREGFVSLTVWDAAGRRRSTLFQGDFEAGPGRRSVTIVDATGRVLPSGVYWLKLESGNERAMQKVVISN